VWNFEIHTNRGGRADAQGTPAAAELPAGRTAGLPQGSAAVARLQHASAAAALQCCCTAECRTPRQRDVRRAAPASLQLPAGDPRASSHGRRTRTPTAAAVRRCLLGCAAALYLAVAYDVRKTRYFRSHTPPERLRFQCMDKGVRLGQK
jgi:hypothetical protein